MLRNKKLLIVEDEVLIAEHLKTILASFECKSIQMAHTKYDALAEIDSFMPDIVLLDINLSDKHEGIEIADYINNTCKLPFIFITAYSDSTTLSQALAKHPAAYITKPFKQADVLAAIQLVFLNNPQLSKDYLNFKDGTDTVRLNTHKITHIEGAGNYIIIYTTEKKYTLRNSLAWALENVPKDIFVKVHRAFIVNINHINELTIQQIKVNNTTIPVSRLYKDELLKKFKIARTK